MVNRNFAVGMFVSLALTIFVAATLWLTGKQGTEPTVDYSIYFTSDVSGLMLGGPVFFLGVEVGTVTAMTITPGDPVRIRVDAKVLETAPVNQGTFASLALQGITGVAVVRLSSDPGQHESLILQAGQQNLQIEVRDTGFSALMSKAPGIVDKLDTALVEINKVLSADNQALLSSMLTDLAAVSNSLSEQQESIGEIPLSISDAMTELRAGLAQIRSMAGELEPGLVAAISSINQATEDLARISARVESWTAESDADMNAFMQDGLGQVPALVADTRRTVRELEKLIKDLRENPSKLIYQPKEDAVDVEQ